MSRKATDFINLPIIHLASGKQLNTVKEVILNAEKDNLAGFICEDLKFLANEDVASIGDDAIIVEEEDVFQEIPLPVSPPLFQPEYVLGTPIITSRGKSIGTIGDIYLSNETGEIESYQVSDGLLKDLVSGRANISILNVLTYGEDAVVINDE